MGMMILRVISEKELAEQLRLGLIQICILMECFWMYLRIESASIDKN